MNGNRSKEEALRHSEKVTDVLRKVREMMVAEVNHGAEINEELRSFAFQIWAVAIVTTENNRK
jgi:hypothetical protein